MEQYNLTFAGEEINDILSESKDLINDKYINLYTTHNFLDAIKDLFSSTLTVAIDVNSSNFYGTNGLPANDEYLNKLHNFFKKLYNAKNCSDFMQYRLGCLYIEGPVYTSSNTNKLPFVFHLFGQRLFCFDLSKFTYLSVVSLNKKMCDNKFLCFKPNEDGTKLTFQILDCQENKINIDLLDIWKLAYLGETELFSFLNYGHNVELSTTSSNDTYNTLKNRNFSLIEKVIFKYNNFTTYADLIGIEDNYNNLKTVSLIFDLKHKLQQKSTATTNTPINERYDIVKNSSYLNMKLNYTETGVLNQIIVSLVS